MEKNIADELLEQTRQNYDSFAESFSRTRDYVWPEFKKLIGGYAKSGDKVLDIGCGNGRLYPLFQEIGADYVGADNSKNLIGIAQNKFSTGKFIVGDALGLPFADGSFDAVVSLAVVHHIPSREYRQKFFQEAARVLKPGGYFIAAAWDLRLATMFGNRQWKRVKGFLKTQVRIALGLEKLDFGDFFIPWQNQYPRYHHAFGLNELKNLAKFAGFEIKQAGIAKVGRREQNLYIIARKA